MIGDGPLVYFDLLKEAGRIAPSGGKCSKIAVLADCTTEQFVSLLKVFLARENVGAEFLELEFNTIELQVHNPKSELYAFDPDYVLILNTTQALRNAYYAQKRKDFFDETADGISAIWENLHRHSPRSVVFQTNYACPLERVGGNLDASSDDTLVHGVRKLNAWLSDEIKKRQGIYLMDLDYVASEYGLKNWFDECLWFLYKVPAALDALPLAARNVAQAILSFHGKTVKCIVLDLDNTLWGGVIGDDGMAGIRLGHGGEGEAFLNFQGYLRDLRDRGILLAVCSKNDPENARLPFREHPDMLFKEEDFAVFIANWENKADNLRSIQAVLQIGWDSIVFLDDSAFERNLVRQELPEVIVPELPEDSALYVQYLASLNLFETHTVSGLDRDRTQLYRQEAVRKENAKKFTNIDDYLKSLEMKMTVAPFDAFHLPRISQLIQRSNQFNLTTRRYSVKDCEAFIADPARHPFFAILRDKYGDSGLISVIVLNQQSDTEMWIDTWLMSCRVLLRGVEAFLMNYVVAYARRHNVLRIVGEYRPTPKNKMVQEFYPGFGFRKIDTNEDRTLWAMDVEAYVPKTNFIEQKLEMR